MGQTSSAGNSLAPTNPLLVDASDSYVTDVKLRSTAVIPISEYIKRDKYSRNLQRLEQFKKNRVKEEEDNENVTSDQSKHSKQSEKQKNVTKETEDRKKYKEEHLVERKTLYREESSNTDESSTIPSKSQNTQTTTEDIKQEKKQIYYYSINEDDSKVKQLYKNKVYPHIYKNNYHRKQKKLEPIELESNMYFSNTEIVEKKPSKDRSNKIMRVTEESTHNLTKHNYEKINRKKKTSRKRNFVVQTNIACVIHPNRNLYPRNKALQTCSEDNIPSNFIDKVYKLEKDHRKFISPKSHLENWKNLHTIKQNQRFSHNFQTPIYKEDSNSEIYGRMDYKSTSREVNTCNCFLPKTKHSSYPNYNDHSYEKPFPVNYLRQERCERNLIASVIERSKNQNFISDIEKCLRQQYKMQKNANNCYYSGRYTWVQDQHRRWHKVIVDDT